MEKLTLKLNEYNVFVVPPSLTLYDETYTEYI